MTMTLAHPPAEDLGRFVDGTLDGAERTAVVAHIADCDECRILVVDGAAFEEEASASSPGLGGRWWAAAAAAIVMALGGAFTWLELSDRLLAPVIEASSHSRYRHVEARLSGFRYVKLNRMRGGDGDDEVDLGEPQLDMAIANVLDRRGDDPKTLHAKGVAFLLAAARAKPEERDQASKDREQAEALLLAAATRAPGNAKYQSDLAAALLASRDPAKQERAIVYLNRALQIDPKSPEALFNLGIALRDLRDPKAQDLRDAKAQQLHDAKAIAAFERYLAVDSSLPWADEARQNINNLR